MEPKQINLLLADDHTMMANGLKQLLMEDSSLNVVAICADGNIALQYLNGNPTAIDVAILDINMPNLDGLITTPIIKSKFPKIKVLILSMYYTFRIIEQVKASGADAFIHKSDEIEKLITAIKKVMNGEKIFPTYTPSDTFTNEITEDAYLKLSSLSEREKQIARLVKEGMTTRKIASLLYLSEYTVDTHRKNILRKLSLKSTSELIRFAMENKL